MIESQKLAISLISIWEQKNLIGEALSWANSKYNVKQFKLGQLTSQ